MQRRSRYALGITGVIGLLLSGCGGGDGSGGSKPETSVSISQRSLSFTRTQLDFDTPYEVLEVTVSHAPEQGIYGGAQHTNNAVEAARLVGELDVLQLQIGLRSPNTLPFGDYSDTVTVSLCYDERCDRHVRGSPIRVAVTMEVRSNAETEPGMSPLPVSSRTPLNHDVIDAEYSKALDAIVMVSAQPRHALYVYDTATGLEREVALTRLPKAVSVSPDGLSAAVGHDEWVTHLDLASVGQPGAPPPKLLNVSGRLFDLVLDGRGFVHVSMEVGTWTNLRSIDIDRNIEYLDPYLLHHGSRIRISASGDAIYAADTDPDSIRKFDIRGGPASHLYDAPNGFDLVLCADVWPSDDGTRLYTACGIALSASSTQAQDMIESGLLELTLESHITFRVVSLSDSLPAQEIALIEAHQLECLHGNPNRCRMHVNRYHSDSVARTSSYALEPLAVGDDRFPQRGLFLFYSADGSQLFLLSRLYGIDDPAKSHFVSVLQ